MNNWEECIFYLPCGGRCCDSGRRCCIDSFVVGCARHVSSMYLLQEASSSFPRFVGGAALLFLLRVGHEHPFLLPAVCPTLAVRRALLLDGPALSS
ncbi:hypothetical protein GDO78_014455 [Eleutherodactylus coqui]|uniref:Uncharacterized protein n=1 Tax=Eleutherodactylus coqui TaxID=57060 RepID=A0A8J6BEV4_ELECQ|nr:hypothetical protein GDO78_014455 [Eleutherodactylus coqui]